MAKPIEAILSRVRTVTSHTDFSLPVPREELQDSSILYIDFKPNTSDTDVKDFKEIVCANCPSRFRFGQATWIERSLTIVCLPEAGKGNRSCLNLIQPPIT